MPSTEVNSILVRSTLWKVLWGQRVEQEKKAHPPTTHLVTGDSPLLNLMGKEYSIFPGAPF